jgi:hypothetical protein
VGKVFSRQPSVPSTQYSVLFHSDSPPPTLHLPMAGRPRALDECKLRAICEFVSAGLGMEEIAHHIGCTAITIRRESRRNPSFCEQLRQARLSARLKPRQSLQKPANSSRPDAQTILPKQPARDACPESDFLSIHAVKHWMEQIVRSRFSEPKDSQIVVRMLAEFDAVLAEYVSDSHAEQPAIPSRPAQLVKMIPTRSTTNNIESTTNNIEPFRPTFCPAISPGESGNPEECAPDARQNSPTALSGVGTQRDEQNTKCRRERSLA